MSGIVDLEQLDKKIAEQKTRMKHQPDKPQEPDLSHLPWTEKMKEAFQSEIQKAIKCMSCNWMNHGQMLIMMNYMDVMKEKLPLPTLVCKQCGSMFLPKYVRRIAMQALEQQNKIIKQSQGVDPSGE